MRKEWFMALLLFLLYACRNEKQDFLHDIRPFTVDSLVNVVIEIPAGTSEKWEVNKVNGQIEWEQVTPDSFRIIDYLPYPANYGFVPQTLLNEASGGDGDPVDVFVLGPAIARGSVIKTRIVAIIYMLDDDETDTKLLAVEINNPFLNINSYDILVNNYPGIIDILKIWLTNYKGPNRIEVLSIENERDAIHLLKTAHFDYCNNK
jgi:inorganic pyrophosphatase